MSSILRFQKQRPSNTLFNELGGGEGDGNCWTYDTIQTYATNNNGVFTAPSVITFPTQDDLDQMTNDLENNPDTYIDSNVAVNNLGKTLYLGVEGDDSTKAVLVQGQIIQGANQSWVVYVFAKDTTNNNQINICRGAW